MIFFKHRSNKIGKELSYLPGVIMVSPILILLAIQCLISKIISTLEWVIPLLAIIGGLVWPVLLVIFLLFQIIKFTLTHIHF